MIPLSVYISNKSYIFVACLGIIYCVLDCVDGTIARNQNISSSFGMYMDSLFGKLYQIKDCLTQIRHSQDFNKNPKNSNYTQGFT